MLKQALKRLHVSFWTVLFHTCCTLVLAALLAAPTIDLFRLELYWHSVTQQGMDFGYTKVLLHLGLAACAWALIVIGYLLAAERKQRVKVSLVKQKIGTTLTEFLIVLVPFLLLTSGLAQLAMLNVTGLLADLAVFQAARVVFVWEPEERENRIRVNWNLEDKARTIASMCLAPTAPNDYYVGRSTPTGSSQNYRRARSVQVGAFMPDGTPQTVTYEWSGGQVALTGGGAFDLDVPTSGSAPENLHYFSAFDSTGFKWRAARKMTQAEWGFWTNFNILRGNRVGVRFIYKYNLIFPWFGWIWGRYETVGMREGYYTSITREHTFPRMAFN